MSEQSTPQIERATLGRMTLRTELTLLSGTRIGGAQDTLDIGGIDNLIVRDPLTGEPYLPGSALKGKARSILEKDLIGLMERDEQGNLRFTYNRETPGGGNLTLYRHECDDAARAKWCPVCRLFGSSGKALATAPAATNFPAKLTVHDAFLTDESSKHLKSLTTELPYAEWKAENTLDRVTAAAMPRQMERAARGARFTLTMGYRIENDGEALDPEVLTDLYNLMTVLSQLQEEGIGGSTSRGYGAVGLAPLQLTFTRKVKVCKPGGSDKVCRIRQEVVDSLQLANDVDRLTWLMDYDTLCTVYNQHFSSDPTALEQYVHDALQGDAALFTPLITLKQTMETLCLGDGYAAPADRKAHLRTLAQAYAALEQATAASYTPAQKQAWQAQLHLLQRDLTPLIDLAFYASYGDHVAVLQHIFAPEGAYQQEFTRVYQRHAPVGQDETVSDVAAAPQQSEESNHADTPSVPGASPAPGQD